MSATPRFTPQVFRYVDDQMARRVALVFRRGRTKYHAVVAAHASITFATFDTLRGLEPLQHKGGDYSPKRAASFWLNHDHREITKRARQVLRGLVARKAVQS